MLFIFLPAHLTFFQLRLWSCLAAISLFLIFLLFFGCWSIIGCFFPLSLLPHRPGRVFHCILQYLGLFELFIFFIQQLQLWSFCFVNNRSFLRRPTVFFAFGSAFWNFLGYFHCQYLKSFQRFFVFLMAVLDPLTHSNTLLSLKLLFLWDISQEIIKLENFVATSKGCFSTLYIK